MYVKLSTNINHQYAGLQICNTNKSIFISWTSMITNVSGNHYIRKMFTNERKKLCRLLYHHHHHDYLYHYYYHYHHYHQHHRHNHHHHGIVPLRQSSHSFWHLPNGAVIIRPYCGFWIEATFARKSGELSDINPSQIIRQPAVLQIQDQSNFSKKIRRGSNQVCTSKKIMKILQQKSKCTPSVVNNQVKVVAHKGGEVLLSSDG